MKFTNSYLLVALMLTFAASLSAQYISSIAKPDASQYDSLGALNRYPFIQDIKASDMKKHLYIIASPEMEGRETGYEGNNKAAAYITEQLKGFGVVPPPTMDSYYQPIALTYTSWTDAKITVNDKPFKHLWDFIAFPNANNAMANVPIDEVVFLGYGINDKNYNDYKKAKVAGKTIMINEGEPMTKDEKYRLTKDTTVSSWSTDLKLKIAAAKEAKVANILVISTDIKKMLAENRRKLLGPMVEVENTKGKVIDGPNVIFISPAIAKEIIGDNETKVKDARNSIMNKGKYKPFSMKTTAVVNLDKKQMVIEGRNIAAYFEGKSKKDEIVVVSAHYDHIGKKGEVLYPGADDNGSGTTTMLELAQTLSMAKKAGQQPERSILLLWVTGEEKGLLGSQYYSEHPIFSIEKTMVDINIDMLGRMDKTYIDQNITNYAYVIGSDRLSTDLHKLNEEINNKYTQFIMDYTYNDANDRNQFYFRSDHYNFARKGIPAIFFFTGVHEDYHQPGDTPDKIGYDKMELIGKHVYRLLTELGNRPTRIVVDGEIK